jgi:hypothetical protein
MTIYTDLNIIDNFEQQHGFEDTLVRARKFMAAYLGLMKKPLPKPTRRSLEAARTYQEGTNTSIVLKDERALIWTYLRERGASSDFTTPPNAIVHAAFGPLTEFEDLKPAETISERVSDFLDCANAFEDHSDSVRSLLEDCFYTPHTACKAF